jgi:hypothetical protein
MDAYPFLPAHGRAVKNPSRSTRTQREALGAAPGVGFLLVVLFRKKKSYSAAA